MKFLVTGVAGQLGHDVMNELAGRGLEGVGTDIAPAYAGADDGTWVVHAPYVEMDITNSAVVDEVITKIKPDAVIHCAAWTAVDAAEDEDKQEKVRAINVDGTRNIANAAKKCGAKMMYISTDYVFDGQGETPWDPDFKGYAPLNVYGRTKLEGELAVAETLDKFFIVRIAWVFGKNGKNYIKTMLDLGKRYDALRIVGDQIGTPTYTFDLARLLVDMIQTDKYGYYHATNAELPPASGAGDGAYTPEGTKTGYISWFDFSKEIFRQAAALGHAEYAPENLKLTKVTTAEYGVSKAARPFNSRLDKSKLEKSGFKPLPDWRDAIARYLQELGV